MSVLTTNLTIAAVIGLGMAGVVFFIINKLNTRRLKNAYAKEKDPSRASEGRDGIKTDEIFKSVIAGDGKFEGTDFAAPNKDIFDGQIKPEPISDSIDGTTGSNIAGKSEIDGNVAGISEKRSKSFRNPFKRRRK